MPCQKFGETLQNLKTLNQGLKHSTWNVSLIKVETELDDQETLKSDNFQYLGQIINKDGEIEDDVNHRMKPKWMKWRSTIGVLCDHRIPIWEEVF